GHPVWSLTFMVQGKKHVERFPEDGVDSVRPRVVRGLLAAAGEGAILAGQAEPHRECSMAVSGDSVAWCREQALRPSGGDFQGIGVYRSDGCLGECRGTRLRAPVIVSMSPGTRGKGE